MDVGWFLSCVCAELPVTEVEKATVVIRMLILKAQVGPAAQAVVPDAQLLRH